MGSIPDVVIGIFHSHNPSGRSGFCGLEVACWPLVPKIEVSNPAETVGFFRAKKSSARLPSEGNYNLTPGKYPKEYIQCSIYCLFCVVLCIVCV